MLRERKSHYAIACACLLALVFSSAAHGRTDDPGNGTEQTLMAARAGHSATRADGSTFAGWGGNCTGTMCELVMDGAKAVTATFRESADAPASALGDSPTVTGTITNLGRGDFAGKALELKAGGFSAGPEDDVFATSPVADDSSFALRLPGEAELASLLIDATPELFGDLGCDTTVTPEVFKLANAPNFFLYVDGQLADNVLQTSGTNLTSTIVAYYYVDRDVTVTGTCVRGDFAGLETDIDMRKGWNTVVLNLNALTYRNEDLSKGYRWVISDLCDDDFECSAD